MQTQWKGSIARSLLLFCPASASLCFYARHCRPRARSSHGAGALLLIPTYITPHRCADNQKSAMSKGAHKPDTEEQKVINMWRRNCPICRQPMAKKDPTETIPCPCGKYTWKG